MGEWLYRVDAAFPFQTWRPFPPEAIVQIGGFNLNDGSKIGPASSFWWGYERENLEGVIRRARRLDRPKIKA